MSKRRVKYKLIRFNAGSNTPVEEIGETNNEKFLEKNKDDIIILEERNKGKTEEE